MSRFVRHAAIASVITLTAFGTTGLARADSTYYDDHECLEDDCGHDHSRHYKGDDHEFSGKRRHHEGDKEITVNVTVTESSDWKYDSGKHKRRRHKDDEYRFYHTGYWYPQPYWAGYGLVSDDRLSCGEGRALVRDRGFYRVSSLDCTGRTFTYLGRRHGETFKVLVNSRTGRIVNVDPI